MIDLINIAPKGKFQSGILVGDNMADKTDLSWNGSHSNTGYIRHSPNGSGEDKKKYNLLVMRPMHVENGTITALLPSQKLPDSALFKVKVGFTSGANKGAKVVFQVWEHHKEEGQEVSNRILYHEKERNFKLDSFQVDLSHLSGQEVEIELRVDIFGTPIPASPIWAEPVIAGSEYLINIAPKGRFESGRLVGEHNMTDRSNLSWNGSKDDNKGFIRHVPNGRCEDGETYDILQMHPKWVDNGTIKAWLPWQKLPESAVLKVKVGFLQGAKDTNGVAFQVWEHHNNEKGQEIWNQILHHEKKYTGKLTTLQVELSHLSGQDVGIELRVDAAGHSTFDWAVWVEPVIEPRVPDVNLIDLVSEGNFRSGTHNEHYRQIGTASNLSLNGYPLDSNGSVIHLQSALCEDGKWYNVLQMNPKQVSRGITVAKFSGILAPNNPIFKAKIGLLNGPQDDIGVEFLVVCYNASKKTNKTILHYEKKYSGGLLEIQAEIPHNLLTDKYIDIELTVVPQGNISKNRPVWIDPIIEGRPTGESLEAESRDRISYIQWAASSETHKHYITPMEDGLHVRWWWHERLPFPRGGFSIKMNDGSTIHIPVPKSPHEVLKRLETHPEYHHDLKEGYATTSRKIYELLKDLHRGGTESESARHRRLLSPKNDEDNSSSYLFGKITIQELLLSVCGNPYLARLVGVYKVIPNIDMGPITHTSPHPPLQIIGHWGDEQWPLYSYELDKMSITTKMTSDMPAKFHLKHCEVIALGRKMYLNVREGHNDILHTYLGFHPSSESPAFRLQFEFPVEYVKLNINFKGGNWKVSCDNRILPSGVKNHILEISSKGYPFQTLDILEFEGGNNNDLQIYKIEFRERIGRIGDQSSTNQSNYDIGKTTIPLSSSNLGGHEDRWGTLKFTILPFLSSPDTNTYLYNHYSTNTVVMRNFVESIIKKYG